MLTVYFFTTINNSKMIKRNIQEKFKGDSTSKLVIWQEVPSLRCFVLPSLCIQACAVNAPIAVLDFALKLFSSVLANNSKILWNCLVKSYTNPGKEGLIFAALSCSIK